MKWRRIRIDAARPKSRINQCGIEIGLIRLLNQNGFVSRINQCGIEIVLPQLAIRKIPGLELTNVVLKFVMLLYALIYPTVSN